MKHDMQRQTTEVHDYGRGRKTSEPVFVRKPGAASEDDGWTLSYVYDPERDLSDVVILDAKDFAGEPVPPPFVCRFACRSASTADAGTDKITVVE